ncbi:MAG: hypothetical protein HY820_13315 [Acidobacteria bacterium]|nr:hypothetical protein [Acidobacteriota bacterium]
MKKQLYAQVGRECNCSGPRTSTSIVWREIHLALNALPTVAIARNSRFG